MKPFILDLWHDLRSKRLAPVAAVLAAALVAVPVLMLKPVSEPAPAPAPAPKADPAAAQLPQLKNIGAVAQTAAASGGSTLSAFESKDPFKPPAVVLNAKRDQSTATASAPKSAAAGAGGSSGSQGGGSGGADSQGGSGGGTTNPPSTAPPSSPPVTRAFAYTADVRFGRSGRTGRYRGLRKLESLPSERNPLLIFLGVTDDGDDAVFLVDSTLRGTGEGRCSPSGSSCATLTIGAGAEHEFVDPEGNSYTLLVDEIRKVDLAKAASARKARARARASVGRGAPSRRFVPPLLADLLTVSTDGGHTSSAGRDRR